MPYTARATMVAPTDEQVSYSSGKALTEAEAIGELIAELKTVVAKSLRKFSVTHEYDTPELAALGVVHADPTHQYEDADLIMEKLDPALGIIAKNKFIENMDLVYKLAGRPNVDTSLADVNAIELAFRDGEGRGGYRAGTDSKYRI